MQTIDTEIDGIEARKTCRYWKKARTKKYLGTSGLDALHVETILLLLHLSLCHFQSFWHTS